ncbi:hypothetical protein Taro_028418, partial [Colocasia esculenta]|nr:hypothetical protein [Colocasia esculenta]
CARGCFRLVPDSIGFYGSRLSSVVSCFLSSRCFGRGSSSWELGVGRVAEAAVAPCVVSSSESECCELLYLSELRVVLCKFSGSVGGDANFRAPGGGLRGRVVTVGGLQLLLCPVCGECGRSVCSCRGGVVGGELADSGLPRVEDGCRQVQAQCSWSSSAHLGVCVSLRVRESTCGVAFTGAGLSMEPVEVSALLLGLRRYSVCRVASLVEHYDTCLWLFVGLVLAGCELWLRCIAWLPCVLVRFPRTVCCCLGEGFPQDYSVLVSATVVLPQGLRYAVVLVGVFWRVFRELCLGGSSGGFPRIGLHIFCSSAYCGVLSEEVLPWSALCSFRATIVLPLWFEVCRLVGLRSGEVLPGRLLALLVEVLPKGLGPIWLVVPFQTFGPLRVAFWRVSGEESFLLARVVSAVGALVLQFA